MSAQSKKNVVVATTAVLGLSVLVATAALLKNPLLEQYDLYQRARAALAKADAVTVTSGTGVVRQHPAAKIALDALGEARQCFRQLGLEMPDPNAPWKARAPGRRDRND